MLLGNGGVFPPWRESKLNLVKRPQTSVPLGWCTVLYLMAYEGCCFHVTGEIIVDLHRSGDSSLWIASVLLCCFNFGPFHRSPGKAGMITLRQRTRQILTHSGGSLREVAQWLRDWGEPSGSVHSSGTAVRCGPFPLSQIYKATCNNTHWSVEFISYSRDAIS